MKSFHGRDVVEEGERKPLRFGSREVEAENDVCDVGPQVSIEQELGHPQRLMPTRLPHPTCSARKSTCTMMGARALRIHQPNLKQLKGTLTACACFEITTTYHIHHFTNA